MENTFEVKLTREDRYRFRIDFGDGHTGTFEMDEPEPLGEGAGPNATRVLGAAVGHCLSASLLFCLGKARIDVGAVETRVVGTIERNADGRLRVGGIEVDIVPALSGEVPARITKCLEVFEDFCTVTASVRSGLEVGVNVELDLPDEPDASDGVAAAGVTDCVA
jgi:organic hydroperoxide reductase OsmC/OhrA